VPKTFHLIPCLKKDIRNKAEAEHEGGLIFKIRKTKSQRGKTFHQNNNPPKPPPWHKPQSRNPNYHPPAIPQSEFHPSSVVAFLTAEALAKVVAKALAKAEFHRSFPPIT